MQRLLIVIGIVVLLVGLLWPWIGKIPLGHLPGDIVINQSNIKVYIPVTSMVVVSVIISFLLWFFRK